MAALGAGGESRRRRTAASSPDLAENGRPCTVLSAGCTGRTRALRGTHLRARVGKAGAGEGCMAAAYGTAATVRNRAREKVGERGRRGRRGSSPQRGASGALARWREAAEQWCVGRPKRGGNGDGG
jgi:hypothetical protein